MPTTDPASPKLIGAGVKRIEDPRLLSGEGRYVADLRPPGVLDAAFLRSEVNELPVTPERIFRMLANAGGLRSATAPGERSD